MSKRSSTGLSALSRCSAIALTSLVLAICIWSGTLTRLSAQSASKLAFDSASVKQNVSNDPSRSNIGLSDLPDNDPTGFLSSAGFNVGIYIGFAYKLSTNQARLMLPQLPKWATTERFDIEARAPGTPSKDQMRLMMQSLLADRFKLSVHFETRQLPVFALVLAKPGKMGPQLTKYTADPECDALPQPGSRPAIAINPADDWSTPCGGLRAVLASGHVRIGSRNLPMQLLANNMVGIAMDTLDKPVIDQTGLTGNYNFKMEFTPTFSGPPPPNFQPDRTGPTFLEALQEQLGLKLQPTTGPINVLVIDRIEQPSPN